VFCCGGLLGGCKKKNDDDDDDNENSNCELWLFFIHNIILHHICLLFFQNSK